MSKVQTPRASLWQQTAVSLPASPPLGEHITADVTIVGAGITGLRAALELARRNVDVVVLDSHEPGWGASGRTGGQVNPLAHATPDRIIEQLGPVYGPRMLNSYVKSGDEVFNLIKTYDMQCDAVQNGWLRAAHCESATHQLEQMHQGWSKLGLDIDFVSGKQLHHFIGSDAYHTATLVKSGGCIQPLSYSRELARVAMEHGASIFGHSPVQKLNKNGSRWDVHTDKGTVTSQWVLYCTNGYTDNTLKGLKKSIIPLISVQAATRPLSDAEYASILPDGHTLADTRRVIYYSRKDNRNRLLFGSLGMSEYCSKADAKRLHKGLTTVYPQLSPDDLEFHWGGRIAFTPDVLPHLHEPAPGLLAGLGYNGRGVAMATVMGRILAERVTGTRQEDLAMPTTPFKSIAFQRFYKLGVYSSMKYFELRDRLDIKLS